MTTDCYSSILKKTLIFPKSLLGPICSSLFKLKNKNENWQTGRFLLFSVNYWDGISVASSQGLWKLTSHQEFCIEIDCLRIILLFEKGEGLICRNVHARAVHVLKFVRGKINGSSLKSKSHRGQSLGKAGDCYGSESNLRKGDTKTVYLRREKGGGEDWIEKGGENVCVGRAYSPTHRLDILILSDCILWGIICAL